MKLEYTDTKSVEDRLRVIERLATLPDDEKTDLALEAIRTHASLALRKLRANPLPHPLR